MTYPNSLNGVEVARAAWGELMKNHRPAFTMEHPRDRDISLIAGRAAMLKARAAEEDQSQARTIEHSIEPDIDGLGNETR